MKNFGLWRPRLGQQGSMAIRSTLRIIFRSGFVILGVVVPLFLTNPLLVAQEKTEVSFTNAIRYFSPNLDGEKDVLSIPLNIYEEGKLVEWRVTILKKIGEATLTEVKTFSTASEVEGDSLSLGSSLQRLFRANRGIAPPDFIEWNGLDDNQEQLSDGVYYMEYYARDETGNEKFSDLFPVIIDTLAPEASITAEDSVFSPNGDGRKEQLLAKLATKNTSPLDQLVIAVHNAANDKVLRSYSYTAANVPETFIWDGLDENGTPIPDGLYYLMLKVSDYAANGTSLKTPVIRLVRAFEEAVVSLSLPAFSPNGDDFFDTLTIDSSLSTEVGLTNWEINLMQEGVVLQSFKGTTNLKSSILFNGRSGDRRIFPDGLYEVSLAAFFDSGNQIYAPSVPLLIDTTAPKLEVRAASGLFNPEARSGGISRINISQSAIGGPEDTYKAVILDENKVIVYTFTPEQGALASNVSWDGKNDNDAIVPGLYRYRLTGQDPLANTNTVSTSEFELVSGQVNMSIRANKLAFSPNNDNVQDNAEFLFSMNNDYKRFLNTGTITIFDEHKKPVEKISFDRYTNKFLWDGLDAKQNPLADGKYFFQAQTTFDTGEEITTTYLPIYIDVKAPHVDIDMQTPIFSPNQDGNLDVFIAENNLVPSKIFPEDDVFQIQIAMINGTVIREKEWTGKIPPTVNWTGVNDIYDEAPSGEYLYFVNTRDLAGNQVKSAGLPFTLVREFEKISLNVSASLISFHPQANKRSVTLTPELSSSEHLSSLDFLLLQQNKTNILTTQEKPASFSWGETSTTKTSGSSTKLPPNAPSSGAYDLRAKGVFSSGNIITSELVSITVDNDPPVAEMVHHPKIFSPDGDNDRETLRLGITAKDNVEVIRSDLKIFRQVAFSKDGKPFPQTLQAYDKLAPPFKSYHWDGPFEDVIIWDGLSDNGELVESANDYIAFLETEDVVGLQAITMDKIQVDIFVERLADGRLRIVLNNINFKFGSEKMVGAYKPILDRLTVMLGRFPKYRIEVLGHSDSRGGSKNNQALSERRAQAVVTALNSRGIPKNVLGYAGAGEKELLIPNEIITDPSLSAEEREFLTEENYRRNRRVEFYLERDDD